jgi:hypothetical protein
MEMGTMLREFICPEKHQIGDTSDTGENKIKRALRKGRIHH